MRILVCGGRTYDDRDSVWRTLDDYQRRYGPITIIQGGATGADAWAKEWCYRQPNVTLISVPANSLISVKAYIYPQHQFAVVGDRTFKAAISLRG